MPRDVNLLSDKDLYVKTANMVEHVRNCKIKILYGGTDNFCSYFNEKFSVRHQYLINLANPPVKGIQKYTALIHELGHVLYETPFYECSTLFRNGKGWIEIKELAHNVYNALEDQRIESHLSRNYLAYGKRFDKTRENLGKSMKKQEKWKNNNPLFILLAIRFKREDLVKNSKHFHVYKHAIENVERTDKYGALRILLTLKKYLLEYNDFRKYETDDSDNLSLNSELVQEQKESDWSVTHQHSKPSNRSPSTIGIPDELRGKVDLTAEQLKDIIAEGKRLGEMEFQEVREKLTEPTNNLNPLPANVTKINRGSPINEHTVFTIDSNLSKKLRFTFRKLQERKKETISEEGYDVEVEQYVENFISGVNLSNCLISNKKKTDASILISIDGSTSMEARMPLVRNLVATLLDSVKNHKNIYVKCNVWSSDYEGKIGITEINGIKDIKKISTVKQYFATPTHMGIEYSRRMLKEMKGKKKLMIMLTDGSPNYYTKGRRTARDIYAKRCKKELQKLLTVTPNVICIGIMNNYKAQERMNKLFGSKRVIYVNSFNYAAEKVIKQFKQVVSNALYWK